MKKKIFLTGLASVLCLSTIAAVVIASNKDGSLFNIADKQALGSGEFVVDNDSISDPDDGVSMAIAISDSGYTFDTKFVGFAKDEGGNLYLPKGHVGYFTNTDPLDLGFSRFDISFNKDDTNCRYSYGFFGSYFNLELANVMNGTSADDLISYFYNSSTNSKYLSYSTEYSSISSSLPNCRYVLYYAQAIESDLYLERVEFASLCSTPAPEKTFNQYSDYKESERTTLGSFGLSNFPFVGNGAYKFENVETGVFQVSGVGCVQSFVTELYSNYLPDAGYQSKGQIEGVDVFQKTVGETTYTIAISHVEGFTHIPYNVFFTTKLDPISGGDSWPADAISATFSADFANFLNSYPLENLDVSYTVVPISEAGVNRMQISLTIEEATAGEIKDYFNTYFTSIADDHHEYTLDVQEYGDQYSFVLTDANGIHMFGLSARRNGSEGPIEYSLMIQEMVLYDKYPLNEIASKLGIDVALLGKYPTTSDSKYLLDPYGAGVTIINDNYETKQTEANTYIFYLASVLHYSKEEQSHYTSVRSNPFDGVQIDVNFDDNDIIIYTNYNEPDICTSLDEAITHAYGEKYVAAHTFPALSEGEHQYMVASSMDNKIFISNCTNIDVNNFIDGGVYDYASQSYLFDFVGSEDLYLGVKASLDNFNNMSLELIEVYKADMDQLMTAAEVNAHFASDENFCPLDDTSTDKAYVIDGSRLVFLDINRFFDYHNVLVNNGYAYSSFKNQHYNATTKSLISVDCSKSMYSYGRDVYSVVFDSSETAPVDFAPASNFDTVFGEINSTYGVNFPNDPEYILPYNDSTDHHYGVIANARLTDMEATLASLGYVRSETDYGCIYERFDATDPSSVYQAIKYRADCNVSGYTFDASEGYAYYEFVNSNNYFSSYSDFMSTLGSDVATELKNAFPYLDKSSDRVIAHLYHSQYEIYCEVITENGFTQEEIGNALRVKGFVSEGGQYVLTNENYRITCQMSHSNFKTTLIFKEIRFTWISSLDSVSTNPFDAGNRHNDLIARSSETGDVYSLNEQKTAECNFYMKSSDIESYLDNLKTLGYKVTSTGVNYYEGTYEKDNLRFEVTIEMISSGIYLVQYHDYSHPTTINSAVLDQALANTGFSGVQIFATPVDIEFYSGSFKASSHDVSFTSDFDIASCAVSDGYTFDGTNAYTKSDDTYNYTIFISDGLGFTIVVSLKS